jgi:hypothetical protein
MIIILRLLFYYITFGLHFDYTTIAMMQWNVIKTQYIILLHLSCGLIAFQLHFDCIKLLHFDCIFVALHYDCKNIALRLLFCYITFEFHFEYTTIEIMQLKCNQNAIKPQCKLLLHLSCGLSAFQLHFDCIKLFHFECIFVALH